jgi:hypothetical protein
VDDLQDLDRVSGWPKEDDVVVNGELADTFQQVISQLAHQWLICKQIERFLKSVDDATGSSAIIDGNVAIDIL